MTLRPLAGDWHLPDAVGNDQIVDTTFRYLRWLTKFANFVGLTQNQRCLAIEPQTHSAILT